MTNADRIRNMDDYDLAIFLENVSCKHADTESWLDLLRHEGGMMYLKRGDIIQANENAGDWRGTVLIVDEIKDWGVQAFVHIPMKGDAFIRLQPEQFEILRRGEAALMPQDG